MLLNGLVLLSGIGLQAQYHSQPFLDLFHIAAAEGAQLIE